MISIFDGGPYLLGEGPHWSTELQALCWVDILSNRVVVKSDMQRREFTNFTAPSAVTASTKNSVEVVDAKGIWNLDLASGEKSLVADIPQGHPDNRSNESQRDALGNVWVGRMNRDDSLRTGELLVIDSDGNTSVAIPDMAIPNTLAWDSNRNVMYFADSAEATIYSATTHDGVPNFSTKRIFSQLSPEHGSPDGSVLSSRGHLFNARWGAHCVLEFDPAGAVVRTIEIPTPYVTSCALNDDESVLFVTTACVPIGEQERTVNDGAVFAITL